MKLFVIDTSVAPVKVCQHCGRAKPSTPAYYDSNKYCPDALRGWCLECVSGFMSSRLKARRSRGHQHQVLLPKNKQGRATATHPAQEKRRQHEPAEVAFPEYVFPERPNDPWPRKKRNRVVLPRNVRALATPGDNTRDEVRALYEGQGGLCLWCKTPVGNNYHIDHIVPLSRGGSNWPENLCITCPTCNISKGARLPQEWLAERRSGPT
jgi:hypothetical protein